MIRDVENLLLANLMFDVHVFCNGFISTVKDENRTFEKSVAYSAFERMQKTFDEAKKLLEPQPNKDEQPQLNKGCVLSCKELLIPMMEKEYEAMGVESFSDLERAKAAINYKHLSYVIQMLEELPAL